MEDNIPNFINKYSKDILLISKSLHNGKIEEKEIEDEIMYKYCNKEKYFNKKGTKILNEEDFINITSILYEYIQIDDYIFLLLEKMNIYLIKIVINGYIKFNLEGNLNHSPLEFYNRKNPQISIVISTFNGEVFLKPAIRSIQNQDFLNIEIIVFLFLK